MRPPVCFGPFVFAPAARLLLRDGRPVPLGDRALDLLDALVERSGEIVPHAELVARVWPRTIVEASSLRVHMAALRRALDVGGDTPGCIVTAPGRGYGFFAPPPDDAKASARPLRLRPLPRLLQPPIGREAAIAQLVRSSARERLVSVVGPGGVGKTTVAIAAAAARHDAWRDGVCFVDLAAIADRADLPAATAEALGQPPTATATHLAAVLRERELLVLFDTCEHVAGAVAPFVRRLLDAAPAVRAITTGRAPLGLPGERVLRLPPLALPQATDTAAPHAPAVRLFLDRAAAHDDRFVVTPETLPLVHRLCHGLDGMPLAIELVATRVYALGLRTLADGSQDLLRMPGAGRRAATPRHRTLGALLDWGHALLGETDRVVLRRLAAIDAPFRAPLAVRVASDATLDAPAVQQSLQRLVAASWVEVLPGAAPRRHRLLATTRRHALAQLHAAGEHDVVQRRLGA